MESEQEIFLPTGTARATNTHIVYTLNNLDAIALSMNPGPDKRSDGHNYTKYYDRHFVPRRYEPLKVLEIGVWEGASLRMWQQYFPQAQIVGADNDITRCIQPLPERVRLWEMDQSSAESLVNMAKELGPWDIIIDDGSHMPLHQVITFEELWPHLNAGGLYCVEDLHVNYHADGSGLMLDYIGSVLQDDLHGLGKTGFADWHNSPKEEQAKLYGRELEIESINLYRYLAIIEKR